MKLYLMSKYGQEEISVAFTKIQDIILKSLQSVAKVIINDKQCFELYGFDILMDEKLKPWLIEVNASPSLTGTTAVDLHKKSILLDDTFTLLDMEKILTGKEEHVGGFDLICRGTPNKVASSMGKNSTYKTYLGCFNNR